MEKYQISVYNEVSHQKDIRYVVPAEQVAKRQTALIAEVKYQANTVVLTEVVK